MEETHEIFISGFESGAELRRELLHQIRHLVHVSIESRLQLIHCCPLSESFLEFRHKKKKSILFCDFFTKILQNLSLNSVLMVFLLDRCRKFVYTKNGDVLVLGTVMIEIRQMGYVFFVIKLGLEIWDCGTVQLHKYPFACSNFDNMARTQNSQKATNISKQREYISYIIIQVLVFKI